MHVGTCTCLLAACRMCGSTRPQFCFDLLPVCPLQTLRHFSHDHSNVKLVLSLLQFTLKLVIALAACMSDTCQLSSSFALSTGSTGLDNRHSKAVEDRGEVGWKGEGGGCHYTVRMS